jgi:hypothetical protein
MPSELQNTNRFQNVAAWNQAHGFRMRLYRAQKGGRNYATLTISALVLAAMILLLALSQDKGVNWVTLNLVVANILIWFLPLWLQFRSGIIDPFHPMVYLGFMFGLPMILMKGVQLALGGDSTALALTSDRDYFLNLALIYTAFGWLCTLFGFYMPLFRTIARSVSLPRVFSEGRRLKLSIVLMMMVVGLACDAILIKEGAFGSSLTEISGNLPLIAVVRPLSNWFPMALFILVYVATMARASSAWRLTLTVAVCIVVPLSLLSGSRSLLFSLAIVAAAAAFYAYPHIEPRKMLIWLVLCAIGLYVGILVSTQYRHLRQISASFETISPTEMSQYVGQALEDTIHRPLEEQASQSSNILMQRLNSIELLAVTLARAQDLKSAEISVGIDDNIYRELASAFIPRPLWSGKPILTNFGLWFSRLYLDSSYVTWSGPSMFGDLYRNFGFWGVPIGMILFGFYLRIIYDCLIIRAKGTLGPMLYLFLLMSANLEGGYTGYLLTGSRISFAALVLFAVIYIFRGQKKDRLGIEAAMPDAHAGA